MSLQIIDVDQNSDAWIAARLGLVTASAFADVLAKGEGKTRRALLHRLAAERVTGEAIETFKSAAMERGHILEDDARRLYALTADAEPKRVGFVRNGEKGCSPDSFIGLDGILEIKTQRSDLLIATLLADRFPPEHVAQCQGALWVAEREWIDICVYWPKMPPFIRRAARDESYIRNLSTEVDRFNEELEALVDRVRRYGIDGAMAA
jgi:hypothetical protein